MEGLITTRAIVDEVRKSRIVSNLEPALQASEKELLVSQGSVASTANRWVELVGEAGVI
jgi:hypothetical protein